MVFVSDKYNTEAIIALSFSLNYCLIYLLLFGCKENNYSDPGRDTE